MSVLQSNNRRSNRPLSARQQGDARIVVVMLVCFLIGVGAGALWIWHSKSRGTKVSSLEGKPLSEGTAAVLDHLSSPVEIRFYSLLDPSNTPALLEAYAERIDRLLAEYQRASSNKVVVKRYTYDPNSQVQNAALADGIKPFNLDKGEGSFFGIAVLRNGQKESLPYLSPEWEPALEFDLTRAIARTANGSQPAVGPAPNDAATLNAVKQLIPNLDSVSVEDGTRLLRDAALQQFAQVAQDVDTKITQAEQRLAQAQSGADQEAAMSQLQQLHAEQSEKLKEIAAQCQAQVDALKRLKSGQK